MGHAYMAIGDHGGYSSQAIVKLIFSQPTCDMVYRHVIYDGYMNVAATIMFFNPIGFRASTHLL